MRTITNSHKFINCKVALPLSKSIVNRLLVIHHFSGADSITELISDSSDTVAMQKLLLKIKEGIGDPAVPVTEINVGNAGTVMRFLTAVLAVSEGQWLITGIERMQQRPVKPLTDALQHLGADLSFVKNPGYPPILIRGNAALNGGEVQLNAGVSSQFISALMMLGPTLKGGIEIELMGTVISASYIRMTQSLMQKTGATVQFEGNIITIKQGQYHRFELANVVEPDWSAAAFWFQVAAFSQNARILLTGLNEDSVQGDSVLPSIFENLGVKSVYTAEGLLLTQSEAPFSTEFNYDFTECPDLAQAVIVTTAALGIKGHFSGLKTLRVKETDRIEALKTELTKLGYNVNVVDDQIVVNERKTPGKTLPDSAYVHCYDDHRMAMSFATLALLRNDIVIDEPEVVKKSYPGFWKDMEMAGLMYSDKD